LNTKKINRHRAFSTFWIIFAGFFGGIYLLTLLSMLATGDPTEDFIMGFIFLVAPHALIVMAAVKTKRRIKRLNHYAHLVSNGIVTFAAMAQHTHKTVAFVRQDFVKMVTKRYLVNVNIDWHTGQILVHSPHPPAPMPPQPAPQPTPAPLPTKCESCGAILRKAADAIVECEYCGSLVQY